MKVQVVVDAKGKVMGAITKGATTPGGDEVILRPARAGHRLHEIDVPDAAFKLSPAEFHKHLQSRLSKP